MKTITVFTLEKLEPSLKLSTVIIASTSVNQSDSAKRL